jgi:murein DD-endopeptidase MepM/ murein hydrolase activator NlpD
MKHRLLIMLVFLTSGATFMNPEGYAQAPAPTFAASWQGTLAADQSQLRLVFEISRSADGVYLGTLALAEQPRRIRIDRIDVDGDSVRLEVATVRAVFSGVLAGDGSEVRGTWAEGGVSYPLTLTRRQDGATVPSAGRAVPGREGLIALPFELKAPVAPVPFQAGGQRHLVYEVHVTNFGATEILLQRIEVLDGEAILSTLAGNELHAALARPGAIGLADNRALGPGLRAIAYIWLSLPQSATVPRMLHHRVTALDQSVEGGVVGVDVSGPINLSPPLRGGAWLAGGGPSNTSGHRRQGVPLHGTAMFAQRFAIDWVRVTPEGSTWKGDEKDNRSHLAYGEEVLAVADAVVSSIQDGIPENVPGATSRAVAITIANTGGNFVNLDLGGGRFAHYAHLQPGSVRVKPGDPVRRGQVLGLVGNSGNSAAPHLHFHVGNADSGLAAEGLPYALDGFELLNPSGKWESRQNELPLQRAIVRFPER